MMDFDLTIKAMIEKLSESEIEILPMPELAPVVRCRDCKYSVFEQWVDAVDIYTCGRTSLTMACGDCSPTDFCSWGERRDDGD